MNATTKPANLTPAQRKALLLVAGGNVVAWLRGEAGYATINGNTEHKLQSLGLITEVEVGSRTRTVSGTAMTYRVKVWTLTAAGRAALGDDAPAAPVKETPAAPADAAPKFNTDGPQFVVARYITGSLMDIRSAHYYADGRLAYVTATNGLTHSAAMITEYFIAM
jgi:hypothetical protein